MIKKHIIYPLIFAAIVFACNKKQIEPAPIQNANTCKLSTIVSKTNNDAPKTSTYEYDTKGKLVKITNGTTVISYLYDENDFLQELTTKYSETYSITDRFIYTNNMLSSIENTWKAAALVRNSKMTYEYSNDGKLSKITTVDYEKNQTESFYKDDILTQQTSNLYTYDINSKGLITKITNKTSTNFSTAGQYVRYTYDATGLKTKSENVNVEGKVVNTVTTEYSTFKDQEIGFYDYLKGKGFPKIGPDVQKYYPKKETTFLLNNTTNMLTEHVSFSYDDYKLDTDGKLLGRTFKYKTTNPKDDTIVILTYNYTGCI